MLFVLPCADTNLNFQVSLTCTLKKEQHLKKRDEGVGKKERKTSKFCLRTDSKMIEMWKAHKGLCNHTMKTKVQATFRVQCTLAISHRPLIYPEIHQLPNSDIPLFHIDGLNSQVCELSLSNNWSISFSSILRCTWSLHCKSNAKWDLWFPILKPNFKKCPKWKYQS